MVGSKGKSSVHYIGSSLKPQKRWRGYRRGNRNDYTLAEGEKVHERSHRRDGEGTEEETGMIIPSQECEK